VGGLPRIRVERWGSHARSVPLVGRGAPPVGVAPFLDGSIGRVLAALLPGPRQGTLGLAVIGYTSAAVAGLLLVTLALSRPADT
jgi:hypothetical protein